jgi:hypothetical protein
MFKAIIFLVGGAVLGLAGVVPNSQIALITDEPTDTPTYGFALTVNHVAVSVRYSDGSFKDLGRIKASEEYIEMMKRLSKPETQHPTYVVLNDHGHTSALTSKLLDLHITTHWTSGMINPGSGGGRGARDLGMPRRRKQQYLPTRSANLWIKSPRRINSAQGLPPLACRPY